MDTTLWTEKTGQWVFQIKLIFMFNKNMKKINDINDIKKIHFA